MATAPKTTPSQSGQGGKNTAYTMQRRLSAQKVHQFDLVSDFDKYGYRNREDITILPPGVLVLGSYNVLTNVGGRVGLTKGYSLDGQANSQITPITSSFDFTKIQSNDTHVRSWQSHFEFRYTNPTINEVTWIPISNALIPRNDVNYTTFWDETSLTTKLLFVNGSDRIFKWSASVASFDSATSNTITKQGTETWAQEGFDIPATYTASLVFTAANTTNGIIATLGTTANEGGNGYTVADILSIDGAGGSGGTASVASITPTSTILNFTNLTGTFVVGEAIFGQTSGMVGNIVSVGGSSLVINNFSGTNWFGGETLNGETSGATATLATFTTTGIVQNVSLISGGENYSTDQNVETSGGSGTGATLSIQAITNKVVSGTITDANAGFLDIAHPFALGESIVVSGTSNNDGTYTIIDIDAGTITVGIDETLIDESTSCTISFTPELIIDGVTYTYTGGTDTTTITGVSPDPTAVTHAQGTAMTNTVQEYRNSTTNGINGIYVNDLIGNLDNQIFIGSKASANIYTSNVNNFLDYSFDMPRLQGQGWKGTIAGYPNAFINQEDNLYVSAGKDLWYESQLNQTTNTTTIGGSSVSIVYETLIYSQLKTTSLQGAQSQAAVTKIKNDIVYLSFEPIINSLGRVQNILLTPQITDLSYSIVNDMNNYDWTDASLIYFRQFLYVSVPKEGLIRIYNMTQPKIQYWEAPVTFPIARFSIIDDALYGHGYAIPETYKLFDGGTFNGHPIPARAAFSYNQYGTRTQPKVFNLFYLEGYISSNTDLVYGFNYDIDGCQTQRIYDLPGSDRRLVCIPSDDASLGKVSLGKRPFSGLVPDPFSTGLPPKFRAIKQLSEFPFYELQIFFESLGKDLDWELVAFGPSARPANEGNNARQY